MPLMRADLFRKIGIAQLLAFQPRISRMGANNSRKFAPFAAKAV